MLVYGLGLGLWCLTPLSTIFQLYRGSCWFMRNKDIHVYIYIPVELLHFPPIFVF